MYAAGPYAFYCLDEKEHHTPLSFFALSYLSITALGQCDRVKENLLCVLE